jgi:hypothetical protein
VSQGPIKFRLFTGVRQGSRRQVGILQGDNELDITTGIAALKENQRRDLLSRVQRWLDGFDGPKNWFHNFPNDQICPACFVFKVGNHRFYGYLYHPLPKTDSGLQLCVLCSHAIKHEWETDPAEKSLVSRWYQSSEAKAALAAEFKDTLLKDKKAKDSKGRREGSPWKM